MATFSEFINILTADQVNNWWNNIAPIHAPEKDEKQNWKYWISKDSKALPFRYCMKELSSKYSLKLDTDSISNDNNRVLFCNKFGFELVEKLVYDQTEENKFRQHYLKYINNHKIFQKFISYANNIVSELGIQPSQVRAAVNATNEILIIIGMRDILTYMEINEKSFVRFIINAEDYERLKPILQPTNIQNFKGFNEALLIELEVTMWDLIPPDFLKANKNEILKNYNTVKNSKRVRWNTDAKTTNSAIKYLVFNNSNVEDWMKNKKTEYLKEYFDLDGIKQYAEMVGETYDSTNAAANWYYDTREKLYYLIELLEKKLNRNYEIVYREAPNGQAGRSKIVFKEYVLAGFVPQDKNIGDELFMKFCFQGLQDDTPSFSIELDINYKKEGRFKPQRDKIFNKHRIIWSLDDDFPKSWDTLISLLEKEIPPLEKDYFYYYNQTLNASMNGKINEGSLNRIFYGPPGTGKTYTAIPESIKLANRDFIFPSEPDSEEGRKLIKIEFERLQKLHRVTLTTFHQSLSYEDFIEGIKPALDNNENQIVDQENVLLYKSDKDSSLEYILKAGIFKNCCAVAAYLCHKKATENSKTNTPYNFDQLYDAFISHINLKIKNKKNPVYTTLKGKIVEIKSINKNSSIIARAKDSIASKSAPLTQENMQKLYDRFNSADEITSLKQVEEIVQVTPRLTEFYAVFKGLKDFEVEFAQQLDKNDEEVINNQAFNLEDVVKKFEKGVYNDAVIKYGNTADSVVLIIDEINRGNIASIFGELITLIETDKRWGAEERLMLKLPYSQSDFFVPVNLYLIGTMNTADRSVEAIDTALRRRFEFKPILPNANALKNTDDGIELSKLLTTLNERLAILKDKDHLIGHAWFWNVKNIKNLQNVFANKIIPLLQEYFYNDYEKLGLLLGKAFFEPPLKVNTGTFAAFYSGNLKNQYQNRVIYTLKDPLAISKEEFIALYQSSPVVAEEDEE